MNDVIIAKEEGNSLLFYRQGMWVDIKKRKDWFPYVKAAQLIGKLGMTGKWKTMSACEYDEIVRRMI